MGQKKKTQLTEDIVDGMGRYGKYKKAQKKGLKDESASARFKLITARAQSIREKHPKMKWKNCIKQASKELFR